LGGAHGGARGNRAGGWRPRGRAWLGDANTGMASLAAHLRRTCGHWRAAATRPCRSPCTGPSGARARRSRPVRASALALPLPAPVHALLLVASGARAAVLAPVLQAPMHAGSRAAFLAPALLAPVRAGAGARAVEYSLHCVFWRPAVLACWQQPLPQSFHRFFKRLRAGKCCSPCTYTGPSGTPRGCSHLTSCFLATRPFLGCLALFAPGLFTHFFFGASCSSATRRFVSSPALPGVDTPEGTLDRSPCL
jgi:hypothetical protein